MTTLATDIDALRPGEAAYAADRLDTEVTEASEDCSKNYTAHEKICNQIKYIMETFIVKPAFAKIEGDLADFRIKVASINALGINDRLADVSFELTSAMQQGSIPATSPLFRTVLTLKSQAAALAAIPTQRQDFDLSELPQLKRDIANTVTPTQVLQANLSSQVTVQAYIQAQTWYTDFLKNNISLKSKADATKNQEDNTSDQPTNNSPAENSTKVSKKGNTATAQDSKAAADKAATDAVNQTRAFCAQALASIYSQGLSHFDSALVLRAMSRAMPGLATTKAAAQIENSCADLVKDEVSFSYD